MNLTITNNGTEPEVVASTDGSEWSDIVSPGQAFDFSDEDSTVAIVGDKPSVREQIEDGLKTVGAAAKALIEAIFARRRDREARGEDSGDVVALTIANHGPNPVRVILGDGVTDLTVQPGASAPASAKGYVEIRELGDLDESQVDGGTQPATA